MAGTTSPSSDQLTLPTTPTRHKRLSSTSSPLNPNFSPIISSTSSSPKSTPSTTPVSNSKALPSLPSKTTTSPSATDTIIPPGSLPISPPPSAAVAVANDLNRPRGQTTPGSGTLASPLRRVLSDSNVPANDTNLDSSSGSGVLSAFFRGRSSKRQQRDTGTGTITSPSLGLDETRYTRRSKSGSRTPIMGSPASWWGGKELPKEDDKSRSGEGTEKEKEKEKEKESRPWMDPPKRKKTIPEEQTEGWVHTRERVGDAAKAVLGTTADIAHELLTTATGAFEYVPIPGLAPAAKVLLSIWDALQAVDTNRLQCLRLTERCADILLSVREEVKEAGDEVGEELTLPIEKLTESFQTVQSFLLKQVHRPFLKRYLKRDEIQGQIQACDKGLGEALGMFGLSIQIRILKIVQEGERGSREETRVVLGILEGGGEGRGRGDGGKGDFGEEEEGEGKVMGLGLEFGTSGGMELSESTATIRPLETLMEGEKTPRIPQPGLPSPPSTIIGVPSSSPQGDQLPLPSSSSPLSIPQPSHPTSTPPPSSQLLPTLKTLHSSQDKDDMKRDMEDLRTLMRDCLRNGSDVEMFNVLGIKREEMPEAIKTLQRALERVGEGDDGGPLEQGKVQMQTQTQTQTQTQVTTPMKEGGGKEKGRGIWTLKRGARKGNTKDLEARRFEESPTLVGGDDNTSGDDTLDREFIESSIDALRRMSRGAGIPTSSLPSWTITRYEISREQKIGLGFFSDVYRGTWRGRTVAIKVLAPTTPRELFVREVQVWKGLRHAGVLKLFGASSASGERPWFFVCEYMRRGSLVEFLKRVERGVEDGDGGMERERMSERERKVTFPVWEEGQAQPKPRNGHAQKGSVGETKVVVPRNTDLFRFMLEIAQGMEYLHANGVLHGDLKAANILVDDDVHCVISDFGQSEMKSEAYRLSGTTPPHGTLRWQAPELMSGQSQLSLTPQMDVREFPPIPPKHEVQHPLTPKPPSHPNVRPSFDTITEEIVTMRRAFLADPANAVEESFFPTVLVPSPTVIDRNRQQWDWEWDRTRSRPSPDMQPVPLPPLGSIPPLDSALAGNHSSSNDSSATDTDDSTFVTAKESLSSSSSKGSHQVHSKQHSHHEDIVSSERIQMPEPVLYTPSAAPTSDSSTSESEASSLFSVPPSNISLENLGLTTVGHPNLDLGGYDSSVLQDERTKLMRDERRYRLLLSHPFHPSLTLPLWEPSPIELGAVGYLSKPEGKFITLFSSFAPEKDTVAAVQGLPSLYGYGRVASGNQRQDRRNVAQRGYDAFVGLLTFKGKAGALSSQSVTRRYSFPLRAGHKAAHMFTESTMYHYMEKIEVPKKWFKANVDSIMQIYGNIHHIQKEDLFLVIGTLDAQDYALFVSHDHPDGQAHFNVFSSAQNGLPWGTFTTDTEVPPELGGPSYLEPVPGHALSSSKVSKVGGNWDTVLIARLRFKPDVLEPTSL
ncbi:hypothetical protein H0H93_009207 [Arthromyces matolae]|nr:hypothetical protein H0H93_009207 [Arthromyces matolae]